MTKASRIPTGFTAITPHLACQGAAAAIEFYKKAFGAVEESRLPGPDGKVVHALIRINGAAVMLGEESLECGVPGPKTLKGSPVTIHIYVDDTDAFVERAAKAGAKVTMPVEEQFWGDRYGALEDPFGHRWSVGTHVRDVGQAEMEEAMKKMMAAHA